MAKLLQIFNHYLAPGGEEKSPLHVEELAGKDFQIRNHFFHSTDWKGPQAPPIWKQAAWTVYNPASVSALRRIQSEYQADAWIVHNVFPVGSAGIYHEALRQGIPIIYFIHNFRPFSVGATLWVKGRVNDAALRGNLWPEILNAAWQDSVLKSAVMGAALTTAFRLRWFDSIKAWIACSDFMGAKFAEAGVPKESIFTLRFAYNPMQRVPPAEEGGFYLFLGRLGEEKGVGTLLKAWDILKERHGSAAPRLLIAGTGPLAELCRRAASANELVDYAGRIGEERKAALLAACRGVVVPSIWWEPLGIVPFEAYDAAKPVLAASSGGLTETVAHGQTGLLHGPGNASQLAGQVFELEQDAERRREMGRRGREWLVASTNEDAWRTQFKRAVEFALSRK